MSKKFSNESFLAFKNLTSDIVNRETDIHGNKVQWLKIRWIRFKKNRSMQMLYKLTMDEDEEFKIVNLNKSKRGYQQKLTTTLHILYPSGRPISSSNLNVQHYILLNSPVTFMLTTENLVKECKFLFLFNVL